MLVGTTVVTNFLDTTAEGETDYWYWVSAYGNETFGESAKCGPLAVRAYGDLTITTDSLPDAMEAVPYSLQLECSGNTGAATWSLPNVLVKREANSFDGGVGTVVDDTWKPLVSYQNNPVISLPFKFTWFGVEYDKITATTHCSIYFGARETSVSWSYFAIGEAPKVAVLEGVKGWGDYTTVDEYRVDIQPDHVTVVFKGRSDGYEAECSATLYPDNTIRLSYGKCAGGGYIAYSNGSDETAAEILRAREDFSGMDDIVIVSLPNTSELEISEDGLLTGVPSLAGAYEVSAAVSDGSDVAWKTFAFTVAENPDKRPVIDATSPSTGGSQTNAIAKVAVLPDETATFTVTAHDPESGALTYGWHLDGDPVSSGSSWIYAPTDKDAGQHTLVCEVADGTWTNGQVYAEWEVVVGRRIRVDAASAAEDPDGSDKAPFKTIRDAYNAAEDGDTILVAPGTYGPASIYNSEYYPRVITIRSTGSVADTFIDGGGTSICVDDGNCSKRNTLIGFTLMNGYTEGTGAASYGVNLKNCVVRNCKAYRAAVYGADLENCELYDNEASYNGGAAAFCTLTKCAIYRNKSGAEGGGAYHSTLDRCTVIGNTAVAGGGIDKTSTATDSIIWGNTPDDFDDATDPKLVDAHNGDWRLRTGSPCLSPRKGAYDGEPVAGYVISVHATGHGTVTPLTAVVSAGQDAVFTFSGLRPVTAIAKNGAAVAVSQSGYTWGNVTADGVLTVEFGASTFYVNAATGNDANAGTGEAEPKASIQAALDAALPGETIYVAEGEYGAINSHGKAVNVIATGACSNTVINANGEGRAATLVYDGRYEGDTVLTGFTVTGGSLTNSYGAGVWGGNLYRCRVTGNSLDRDGDYAYGAGVAEATCHDCLIDHNFISGRNAGGAGAAYCTLYNCTVGGNEVAGSGTCYAGGIYSCDAFNTAVVDNKRSGTGNVYVDATDGYNNVHNCYIPNQIPSGNFASLGVNATYYPKNPGAKDIVNAGDNKFVKTETDFYGNPRVSGGTVDIGCYELPISLYCSDPEKWISAAAQTGEFNIVASEDWQVSSRTNALTFSGRSYLFSTGNAPAAFEVTENGGDGTRVLQVNLYSNPMDGDKTSYLFVNQAGAFWPTNTGTRYGLFIGVNEYDPSLGRETLKGCVADATNLLAQCVFRGGWAQANTTTLLDDAATFEAIETKMAYYADRAVAGDTVFISFSGHGISSSGGSLGLATYESTLWDSYLGDLLMRFKDGVHVIFYMDACYAASLFRGEAEEPKASAASFIAAVQAHIAAKREALRGTRGGYSLPENDIGWIASVDFDQIALDSAAGGAFTAQFLAGWRSSAAELDGDGAPNFHELFSYAKRKATGDGKNATDAQCANEATLLRVLAGSYGNPDGTLDPITPDPPEPPAPVNVTVTFDANGGVCAETSRTVEKGQAIGELPSATLDGYDLDGWYTAATNGTKVTEAYVVNASQTLYAHWTEIVVPPSYTLVIEDGVLKGYTGTLPATLSIPSTVTAFAAGLFADETGLTRVTGGRNVVKCGAGAFRNSGVWNAAADGPVIVCNVIVGYKGVLPDTLEIPYGTKAIADGAFAGSMSLVTLYLTDSLVSIGDGAFAGCSNLDDVYGLADVGEVAANAFEDTLYATFRLKIAESDGRKTVIGFKGPLPAEVVIPDDISAIGGGAFISQPGLTDITLSPNIEIIGTNAFSGCTGLASIELPEKLEFIAERAFRGCTGLTAVNLPASLKTIEESAFRDCSALATVTGGENVNCLRTSAFDGTAWYDAPMEGEECVELVIGSVLLKVKGQVPESYEISSNVTMVASGAFAGVKTLSDLYIGTEVVSLWDRAFAGCTSLGSVTVPAGCCEFGDYLFDGCSSLTNVFFRGHAPTNSVPHVFAGTPENLTVRIKEGSRGWLKPGSDERPKYWPVNGQPAREVWQPEEVIGVMSSRIIDGTITNRTTLTGGRVYEIHSSLVIASGARLTIEAGAILKFANQRNLYVHGELFTRGTKENPVVFTSIKDDTYGGDTNGDGARSNPNPGDWNDIWIYSGKADFQYTDLLYSGGGGSERGVIAVNGGNLSMTGCTIAHSGQDGVWNWDGSIAATNCVFTDLGWATAPYRGSRNEFVNCVFYDVNVAMCYWSHWSGRPVFRNCIFARCTDGWCELANRSYGDPPANWGVTVANSVFWNDTSDPGLHTCGLAGKDGNIYANPLLIDPENWDFRISPESPCVDAGDGTVAPEYDYYGQPRMDVKFARNTGTPTAEGVYPDIGIYEVPGSTTRLLPNLEVIEIASAPASVAPGETLTVTYTVKNAGDAAAKGTIRDTVRIKSAANGGTLAVGTVTQSYNLAPDGSAALVAAVTMPAAPAGDWYVGVDVNPNRDVYEQNMQKNSLWTEDAIEVTLPNLAVGGSTSVSVASGATKGYILADVPAEGGVVVITGVASSENAIPVIARVATGHMPTAAMNDATSFVRADGAVVLVVPPHADGDTVYLAIENTGIEDLTLNSQLTTLTTELWAVYPETAANVGDMGFTFTGSGLNAESEFYLGNIKAKSVSVIDSANVYAVFDVQNIPADIYYSVSADGKTLRNAVYINKKARGPILQASLELPERTRDNRTYTGYIVYANTGDTQMNMPVFTVERGGWDKTTLIGAYDATKLAADPVVIAGIGSSHPAGILKPGDYGRLPFKFRPVGSYDLKLSKWTATADDVAEMATRLNLRGRTTWDGRKIRNYAINVRNGNPVAGVSGYCLDSRTHEPLEGVSLILVSTNETVFADENDGTVGTNASRTVASAFTDANGYYQFSLVPDGVYWIDTQDKTRIVSGANVEISGQQDVNGHTVFALPTGRIHGYVYGDDGSPVAYSKVSLALDEIENGLVTWTDGYGAYSFDGLADGDYRALAAAWGAYGAAESGLLAVNPTSLVYRADFVLAQLACVTGTVTCAGEPVTNGTVSVLSLATGVERQFPVDDDGTYAAEGVDPGECKFRFTSEGYLNVADDETDVHNIVPGVDNRVDIEAVAAPTFNALAKRAFLDESKNEAFTNLFFCTLADTNIVSWTWHFSEDVAGDDTVTAEGRIYHIYTRTGDYDVTLTTRTADGTERVCTLQNIVQIKPPVETKLQDNVIILSADKRENAGDLLFVDFGPEGAEDGKVMRLRGDATSVPFPLDGAVVMVGFEDEEGNVTSGIRRILSHETDGDLVTCATEDGSLTDVFKQYASVTTHRFVKGIDDDEGDDGRGGTRGVGSVVSSIFGGAGEMIRKTTAHALNGAKIIGDGTPVGIGVRVGEKALEWDYTSETMVNVDDYYKEVLVKDKDGHVHIVEKFVSSETNNVCRQTALLNLDYEPYVTIKGSVGAGWEKRTDKCELKLLGKWGKGSIKVYGLPIVDFQAVAQFRPYIGLNLNGQYDAGIHLYGQIGFSANFVDGSIHWKKPEFSIDPWGLRLLPTIRNIKIESGSLDAGVGVLVGVKAKVLKLVNILAGVEASATFTATLPANEPSMTEISVSANAVLEGELGDPIFFKHIMSRCTLFKLSGTIWNFCKWRWTSDEADFDWWQEFDDVTPGDHLVFFEDWSKKAHKSEFTTGFGEGITGVANWNWWPWRKKMARKYWTVTEEYPFTMSNWHFGDGKEQVKYFAGLDRLPNVRHNYAKAGAYTVSYQTQCAPYISLQWCTKEINVEDEPEEEETVDDDTGGTQRSYDPNEMAGPAGVGEQRFVKPGQKLTYTIYFENKADAQIAAQEVSVTNSLSEYLDWSTFEMKTVSTGGQIDGGLDGYTAAEIAAATVAGLPLSSEIDQTNGLYKTRTEVRFDAATGVASWYIRVLDPKKRGTGNGEQMADGGECWPDDPDAGVLQPNTVSPIGEGYIVYSVCVSSNAPANAVIGNSADIVFDTNPVIVTDPAWFNTVGALDEPLPVHRFYSKNYKGHFFTIDEEEKQNLIDTNPNWRYEGTAYKAYTNEATGTTKLYRFYSKGYRGHFFTIDADEAETVKLNPNWRYEGIAYYVYPAEVEGAVPVFRFWSKGYRHHFYTTDEAEKDNLIATNPNWKYEGIAFYALPADNTGNSANGAGRAAAAGKAAGAAGAGMEGEGPGETGGTGETGGYGKAAEAATLGASGEVDGGACEIAAPWTLMLRRPCPGRVLAVPDVADLGEVTVETSDGMATCLAILATGATADAGDADDAELRLTLPDGVFTVQLWDGAGTLLEEREAEGAFDFALAASGVWRWLIILDANGEELFSVWLRAE